MAKSLFFFFLAVSLMFLLAAASTTAAAGNATSGLRYGGCAPGDTVRECITAEIEEDGVEALVRRVLQQQRNKVSYRVLQKQRPASNCKIIANCIGIANQKNAPCTSYERCKRATG
ncbi:Protein RALF-like 27 [Raphanus sativus]|uniref:Protein RALF-like 27 n=1 Tax=Raphanus sativus TaxID=3726 RepID=A0A6J0NKJ5_RAPSA|nr:protein RALF-like 27 [Raphanus sativus]KAJ4900873.1 Protein RALF-like 27 [Raphanus sativus]